MAVFDFIAGWYNPHRRHSALDHQFPLNYERRCSPALEIGNVHLSTETGQLQLWLALEMQFEVLKHVAADGPWHITLVLH